MTEEDKKKWALALADHLAAYQLGRMRQEQTLNADNFSFKVSFHRFQKQQLADIIEKFVF